ncbi:hypothetical protein ZIOFF_032186 [Zingiber officinale]|uniref:Uncharacterized protein n=1 Tax=Zingiber officinale TaxID=94328 RepID=A0A8J5L111_ZINOF|nr:hypothetical protein ZIOFF_032186 [Zingiber officinale]
MQDKAAAEDSERETFSKKPRHYEAEMPLTDSKEDSFLFPVKEIVQYPLPGYVAPSSISFSPDGRLISYLFSLDGTLHRKGFAFEVASRRQEFVICPPDGGGLDESNLSAEEKLRRERSRERGLGVMRYEWKSRSMSSSCSAPGKPTIMVPLPNGLFCVPFCGCGPPSELPSFGLLLWSTSIRKSSSCYQSVDPERELEIITILEQEPLCMLKSQRAPFLIMLFYISELLVFSSLATIMDAGFKGEFNRFQPGVRMEIFRLDACRPDCPVTPQRLAFTKLTTALFCREDDGDAQHLHALMPTSAVADPHPDQVVSTVFHTLHTTPCVAVGALSSWHATSPLSSLKRWLRLAIAALLPPCLGQQITITDFLWNAGSYAVGEEAKRKVTTMSN